MAGPAPAQEHTPIPEVLPGMCLRSTVVFPFDVVSVQVDQARSLEMIHAHAGDAEIVACLLPRDRDAEIVEDEDDFLPVGVACRVIHRMRMPNDTVQVVFQGLRRIRLREVVQTRPYFRFRIEEVEEREPRGTDVDGMIYRSMEMVDQLVRSEGGYPSEMVNILRMNISGAGRFADLVAAHVRFPLPLKAVIAATEDARERLRIVEDALQEAIARVEVEADVARKVKKDIEQNQREHLLRAQLRTIRRELGLEGDGEAEILDLRERIAAAGLPAEVAEAARREVDRLATMSGASAESQVVRTYVGWILDLPWTVPARKPIDLRRARRILDRDHHGLEEVKERILEFLAVRRLRDEARASVLCLVGPPGVGKTSLGRSIAEAMGREFVRLSVGGMHDEAEIKGHRRTYVGAMPGKLLQALKRVRARDPVFVIDEIDKMGSDARGDPSSAMLEVLDPEQNAAFLDHYLDLPFDLSRVFFVCTGNVLEDVPAALRDRLEVVTLSGYTPLEKLEIARRHLLPKVLADSGLSPRTLRFTDAGLGALIEGWTREAGVRELMRRLARIARRRALELATGGPRVRRRLTVDPAAVRRLLGAPPHAPTGRAREPVVGVAAGLAWTPAGGDLLYFEATRVPGKGAIRVTGRLGEVMRESAEAAWTWLRSVAHDLDVPARELETSDVHLHVPEGAIPKDGPSAGVTMAVCLASLFTERPVRADVALTGEITLKGRVLRVGGIKEKLLAAHRAGIRTVLLPAANEADLEQVPPEVLKALQVHLVRHALEDVRAALLPIYLPVPGARPPVERAPGGPPPRPREASTEG